jgi:hypothetical protein
MLLHIVLFRPRAALPAADRQSLVAAIERAHRDLAVVRRFQVGRRVLREAAYAAAMPEYPFVAVVEVDNEDALRQYLTHPAHAELARLFWATSDSSLAFDFDMTDATSVRSFLT